MPEIVDQLLWLLKKLGRAGMRNAQYYAANPGELLDDVISYAMEHPLMFAFDCLRQNATHYIANPAQVPRDLIAYAKENPWKFTFACLGIALGIVSIVLPPVIGFGAAGPVLGSIAAGWQSSIGSVAAGSTFAVIQSMAMTGAFTAIGGTLIGIGTAIPLIGSWFGSNTPGPGDQFGSWMGGWPGSDSPGPGGAFGRLMYSSLSTERMHRLTANPDAVSKIRGMKPKPGWFLESIHSKVDVAGSSKLKEGAKKRILATNSKETWHMVWDRMDAWRDGTVTKHALRGFDVSIVLFRPEKGRPDEGFCEVFMDHETNCHQECWCLGDLDDI